jgi:hypothetical protein
MTEPVYGDPRALRQAVTDRLRRLASERGGSQLSDLHRQFAYDRLLTRVFQSDADGWVLKGATAMLARLDGQARHTVDIDLYRRSGGLGEAERALRAAARVDLGDYFRFELRPAEPIAQGGRAVRVPVIAYVGVTEFARFHVDLVTDVAMTGTPDEVSPLVTIELPGIARVSYRAYPVPDHIADKVCGLLELHERVGAPAVPSTRYRDLADLATFAHTANVEATDLTVALRSQARRRGLELPDQLFVPTGSRWPAGYARVARDVPGLEERDLEAAMTTVGGFIDPVLSHVASGRWDPERLRWDLPLPG